VIQNGATQWMTAGAGILHIERPPDALIDSGGLFTASNSGSTCRRTQDDQPRYQDIEAESVSLLTNENGDAIIRVIPDHSAASTGRVRPQRDRHLARVLVARCATVAPLESLVQRAHLRARRQGSVGLDRSPIAEGQMAVHVDGDFLVLSANESQDSRTQALEVLVLAVSRFASPSRPTDRS